MHPLNLIVVTTIFAFIAFTPASAGQEMPMYQFPQANQMPVLPQPTQRPRDVTCTPAPAPQGGTTAATANASSSEAHYHVVDGKCVPVGGN